MATRHAAGKSNHLSGATVFIIVSIAILGYLFLMPTLVAMGNANIRAERMQASFNVTETDFSIEGYKTEFMAAIDRMEAETGTQDVEVIFYTDKLLLDAEQAALPVDQQPQVLAEVHRSPDVKTSYIIEVSLPAVVTVSQYATVSPTDVALHEFGHIMQNKALLNETSDLNKGARLIGWYAAEKDYTQNLEGVFGIDNGYEYSADCFALAAGAQMASYIDNDHAHGITRDICATPAAQQATQALFAGSMN